MSEKPQLEQQSVNQEKEPTILIPEAYLKGADGYRIVARVKNTDEYVLLTPPAYNIREATRGSWVKDAAVSKQRFELFDQQTEITDIEAFVKRLSE